MDRLYGETEDRLIAFMEMSERCHIGAVSRRFRERREACTIWLASSTLKASSRRLVARFLDQDGALEQDTIDWLSLDRKSKAKHTMELNSGVSAALASLCARERPACFLAFRRLHLEDLILLPTPTHAVLFLSDPCLAALETVQAQGSVLPPELLAVFRASRDPPTAAAALRAMLDAVHAGSRSRMRTGRPGQGKQARAVKAPLTPEQCEQLEQERSASMSPWVGTQDRALQELCRFAHVTADDTVLDIGCGDARVLCHVYRAVGARGVGVELKGVWAEKARSRVREEGLEDHITILQGDVMALGTLPSCSIVYLFMTQICLDQLRAWLWKALPEGTRIVTCMSQFQGEEPTSVLQVPGLGVMGLFSLYEI